MITSNELEKKRPLFFFTGLVIALGIAIGSFEYSVPIASMGPIAPDTLMAINTIDDPVIIFRKEPKKPEKRVNETLAPVPSPEPEPLTEPKPTPQPDPNLPINLDSLAVVDTIDYVDPVEVIDVQFIQHKPVFPGCENLATEEEKGECLQIELQKFIAKNAEYPRYLREMGVQGKSYVKFTINEYGQVVNVEAVEGRVDSGLDKAAKEAIEKLPRFTPGKHNGLPARTQFIVPVNFRMR